MIKSELSTELMGAYVSLKPARRLKGRVRGWDPANNKWWVIMDKKLFVCLSGWYTKDELAVEILDAGNN